MKFEILLAREPFAEILVETLRGYLKGEFDWTGTIQWQSASLPFPGRALLANGKLNVIYPASLPRQSLQPITREYAYHENPWRHLLQRTYVRFATSFPLEWVTTHAVITINPWPDGIDKWCIVPGNHSLRIIDLEHNTCRVIPKVGFNREFMAAEIALRQNHVGLPIPKLLHVDQVAASYTEERIIGLPLGRIPDLDRRKAVLAQAQEALCQLYAETRKIREFSPWIEALRNDVEKAVKELPGIYLESDAGQIMARFESLGRIAQAARIPTVETVLTHGDFQGANIFADGDAGMKRLYLIDWEYAGHRFHLYDALVYSARSRFPIGLASRLAQLKQADCGGLPEWRWCLDEDRRSRPLEDWSIACFLMEDLLVRLKEQRIPGLKAKSEGLMQFLFEAGDFVEATRSAQS